LPSGKAREEKAVEAAVRKCLVSGETKPKDQLIRFVVGPEGQIVPDVAGKLPGRGIWVSALAESLAEAVRKNLFSKAAKRKVSVAEDLPQQVEKLLMRRCLDLLGLARGAGLVVSGEPQVLEALKKQRLSYVVLAADAGGDILKKMAQAPRVACVLTRDDLGRALGRGISVALGLHPGVLADKLKTELARLSSVKSFDLQPGACPLAHNPECGHHD